MPCKALILLAALSAMAYAEMPVDEARQEELVYLLKQDCGSCHGLTMKGGLGPPLLARDLEDKPDAYLMTIIAKGAVANGMPPWEALLSEADIEHIVQLLRTDAIVKDPG